MDNPTAHMDGLDMDLAHAGSGIDKLEAELSSAKAENVKLKEELAACKVDAERYRWLRNPTQDVGNVIDKRVGGINGVWEYRAGDELDAAIDAAMSAERKE